MSMLIRALVMCFFLSSVKHTARVFAFAELLGPGPPDGDAGLLPVHIAHRPLNASRHDRQARRLAARHRRVRQVGGGVEHLTNEELFDNDRCKGEKLLRLMRADIAEADGIMGTSSQVRWRYNDLDGNLWEDEDGDEPNYPDDEVLYGLSMVWDPRKQRAVKWTLAQGGFDGVQDFDCAYDAVNGLIIVTSVFARGTPDPTMPFRWSDVAFLEWQHQTGGAGRPANSLKWIFKDTVINFETLRVVDEAMNRLGRGDRHGLKSDDPWEQRLELTLDSDEGLALLGSPSVYGAAWLLINHKAEMGVNRVLSKIYVFFSGATADAVDMVIEF